MFDRKTDNGKSYFSSDFTSSSWKYVDFIEFYKKKHWLKMIEKLGRDNHQGNMLVWLNQ